MEKEILRNGDSIGLLGIMGIISDIHGINTPAAVQKADNEYKYRLYKAKQKNTRSDDYQKNKNEEVFNVYFREDNLNGGSRCFLNGEIPSYIENSFLRYGITLL